MACDTFNTDAQTRLELMQISIDRDVEPNVYTVYARYIGIPPLKLPGPIWLQASDEDYCVAMQQTADDAADALEPPA